MALQTVYLYVLYLSKLFNYIFHTTSKKVLRSTKDAIQTVQCQNILTATDFRSI